MTRKTTTAAETRERIYDTNTKLLGIAFHRDCAHANALPKLSRCESVAERSFIHCLEVLKRLQARRTGQRAPK